LSNIIFWRSLKDGESAKSGRQHWQTSFYSWKVVLTRSYKHKQASSTFSYYYKRRKLR